MEVYEGTNVLNMNCDDCENGIYTIVVKGEKINLAQKVNVIKNI